MSAEYNALVLSLRAANVGQEAAERYARQTLGVSGNGVEVPDVDEDALEKAIEHEGDKIMRGLGFEIVRFSQPRATKQTPGIADRRYYRRHRLVETSYGRKFVGALALWWEAKSATGEQTPAERLFQEMVEACGETYLLGTHEALIAWLVERRIAVVVGGVLEPVDGVTAEAV